MLCMYMVMCPKHRSLNMKQNHGPWASGPVHAPGAQVERLSSSSRRSVSVRFRGSHGVRLDLLHRLLDFLHLPGTFEADRHVHRAKHG